MSISRSLTRLYRLGLYPPLRGTFLSLDAKQHMLYSRGSVEFFETYPGMYTPRPLRLKMEFGDQTPTFLAKEVLGLTKMNWNNTQFDNSMPITLAAARQVGNVVKYIADEEKEINPHYSFYM
jgi:argonaute-like protein implicated in RNA metabolism and viral defense